MDLPFIEFWYQHLEHDYERWLDNEWEKLQHKKSKQSNEKRTTTKFKTTTKTNRTKKLSV